MKPRHDTSRAAPARRYRGGGFALDLPGGWWDRTVHVLRGPDADGLPHRLVLTSDPSVQAGDVRAYGAMQVRALEQDLRGCRVLRQEEVRLRDGRPAYRATVAWFPQGELCLYQEHLFVLHGGTGYRLSATFTKKTWKTLGPGVERMMLAFTPD
jgi:hypothetical protein